MHKPSSSKTSLEIAHPPFVPFPLLENQHLMTIVPGLVPRHFPLTRRSGIQRLFEVEADSQILAFCHWQKDPTQAPTVVVIHGLEGRADSHCVLGITEKSLSLGMNVVRINMRNCGGSAHLTPTLYNSGMSSDALSVIKELRESDHLQSIFLVGSSMGGNIVLKAAAELKDAGPELLAGVCAVSPALDLAPCVDALERGFNRLYEQRFLMGLKGKLKEKAKLYPERFDSSALPNIRSIRQFDDYYTAPDGGYLTAANYYQTASALPLLSQIQVPTLIIQAQDDPFVPFGSFSSPNLNNPFISLLAPKHGGHGGFFARYTENPPIFDRFWAENRVVTFCEAQGGQR